MNKIIDKTSNRTAIKKDRRLKSLNSEIRTLLVIPEKLKLNIQNCTLTNWLI